MILEFAIFHALIEIKLTYIIKMIVEMFHLILRLYVVKIERRKNIFKRAIEE